MIYLFFWLFFLRFKSDYIMREKMTFILMKKFMEENINRKKKFM